jgi:hypothetical protein
MPVHKSLWNQVARGLKYVQVVTVGIHEREGNITGHKWGPSGVEWLKSSLEKIDRNRSHEYGDWNGFAKKFDDLMQQRQLFFDPTSKQNNAREADLLKAFVRSYFSHQTGGQVSFVKHKDKSRSKSGSSYKRIEIYRPQVGDWVPVWEDELE